MEAQPTNLAIVAVRLTIYMDPYGRFSLSEMRAAYPIEVELPDGYEVVDDRAGGKALVGPRGNRTAVGEALKMGFARIV